jgi:hypothetical protein
MRRSAESCSWTRCDTKCGLAHGEMRIAGTRIFTGAPVPLAEVGTDPTLGLSPERGTGTYRVPSLRGAGARGALLHDASAPSLDAVFDPARAEPTYTGGRGGGPIPGHPWNVALPRDDRAAVLAVLKGL